MTSASVSTIEKTEAGYKSEALFVTPHFTSSQLAALFVQFQSYGLDKVVWYQDPPDLRWFLNWSFDTKNLTTLVAYVQDLDGEMALAGISWVYPPEKLGEKHMKGEIGFCFLPTVSTWTKVKLGRLMLEWIKDNLKLDYMFGVTPEPNEAALAFSKRLGFEQTEPIKNYCAWNGKPTAAIFSYMDLKNVRTE